MNRHLCSRRRTSRDWKGGLATSTLEEKDYFDVASALEEALEEGMRGRHFDKSIASCSTCSTGVLTGMFTIKG